MLHLQTKLPCQKVISDKYLRQIEWEVQNGPITKNAVLPVTTFVSNFFSFLM